MNCFREYINCFFNGLQVYEDEAHGHSYKTFIHQSIEEFLEDENKTTAFNVYLNFFDAYKINMGDEKNHFLDLLDMMLSYEENAAVLTSKQRDHYVHSVNVFLLGIAIYGNNKNYRGFFEDYVIEKEKYANAYKTDQEEFFYRWGITSLFHDVGYPIEIVSKQTNQYLNFLVDVVCESPEMLKENAVKVFIEYKDFSKFNRLPSHNNYETFCSHFSEKEHFESTDKTLRPIDLLAHSISKSFDLDYNVLKAKLDGFVGDMQEFGFVDHGFYSAIIVLQWYAYLMQKAGWKPDYYFTPIVDCAAAILLHNYYGNVLQKPTFSLAALSPQTQPLAYLLILCDELQEWNRTAYGSLDKTRVAADSSEIKISDTDFKVVYISEKDFLGDEFEQEKRQLLFSRLDINALFPNSFEVDSINASVLGQEINPPLKSSSAIPRPLLYQLESIAKEIHQLYCEEQKDELKTSHLEMVAWNDLPEDIKYSNLSQARHITDKLNMIRCGVGAKNSVANPVRVFSNGEVEELSKVEHNRWVQERFSTGWSYGETKNIKQKRSPYLVGWDHLSDEIKELDRKAVRNIIALLEKAGLAAYRL